MRGIPDMTAPWSGHTNRPNRPGTPSMPGDNLDPQELASLRNLMKDGEWYSRAQIMEATGKFNLLALDAVTAAEDDHGSFWCIPDSTTPEESPAEYAVRHGLPSNAATDSGDIYRLIDALRQGTPAEIISKETGILPQTLRKYARALGVELQTYENFLQPQLIGA